MRELNQILQIGPTSWRHLSQELTPEKCSGRLPMPMLVLGISPIWDIQRGMICYHDECFKVTNNTFVKVLTYHKCLYSPFMPK